MRHASLFILTLGLLVMGTATSYLPVASAQSAITFDRSTSWIGQANSVTLSITSSKPNEILLVGDAYNPNPGDIEPVNSTLTFHEVAHYDSYSPSTGINIYWTILPTAQTYSVTIAYPPGVVNNMGIILSTFSGEDPIHPDYQFDRAMSTNSVPAPSITTANPGDLIWAFTGSNNPTTQTAGPGFALDRQRLYFGSPADEYGFGQSQVRFGTSVTGLWILLAVEIRVPTVTGQTVPVNVSPSTTAAAGSALTVSANTAGLLFSSPTYSWAAAGCPDFANPGSVPSFSYQSTPSGETTNCVFSVSVSDVDGDTGSGQSATVTINSATGQNVPVNVLPSTSAPAGSTLTVSANTAGLAFSSPTYAWSATGCPDYANPGNVASFSYVSTSSGTTTNCTFGVSVSDSFGNTGSGQSPTVTITTANPVLLDTSVSAFGQFSSKTIQIVTSHPNELILVGIGFNSNYQISTPTAPGLTFYPLTGSALNGGASLGGVAYYAIAGAAQQYSITVAYANGVVNNMGFVVVAFYGENPTSPFDGAPGTGTSGGVSSAPSVVLTPTHGGDTLWAFQANGNCVTQTAGPGYHLDRSVGCYESPADEYATGVGFGSQTVAFGVASKNWVAFAVAIQ